LPVEGCGAASNVGLPVVISSVLVEFVDGATPQTLPDASPRSSRRNSGCRIVAPATSLSLSESLSVLIASLVASEAPRLDVLLDISKGSSRNADHHGMFLNSVFLGVWAVEEVVPAICVVEEPDSCIGDGDCGGVIPEDRAGATNIEVMAISGAGDGNGEGPWVLQEVNPWKSEVVEIAYHVVLSCEIDDYRISFPLLF